MLSLDYMISVSQLRFVFIMIIINLKRNIEMKSIQSFEMKVKYLIDNKLYKNEKNLFLSFYHKSFSHHCNFMFHTFLNKRPTEVRSILNLKTQAITIPFVFSTQLVCMCVVSTRSPVSLVSPSILCFYST